MDIATINSKENSNLKNFNSTFNDESSNGQFVILQMNDSNEIYAVPCSIDVSEQDIFKELTKDGFLIEECQQENRFVSILN